MSRHVVVAGTILWDVPSGRQRARARRLLPVLEALPLPDQIHGWRPGRSLQTAQAAVQRLGDVREVTFLDVESAFSHVSQARLFALFGPTPLWSQLRPFLPETGLAYGCPVSPALFNLYVAPVAARFECVFYGDDIAVLSHRASALRAQLLDIDLRARPKERPSLSPSSRATR